MSVSAASTSSAPAFGLGSQGILGPRVFRIASPEFLANDFVGVGPEAGKVIGDLLWTKVRSQKVQQDGDSPERDSRCLGPGEDLLDANCENRRFADGVIELYSTATGYFNLFRAFAIYGLQLSRRQT